MDEIRQSSASPGPLLHAAGSGCAHARDSALRGRPAIGARIDFNLPVPSREGLSPAPLFPNRCARMDSNHHGEISPQGPQPHSASVDTLTGVQIVHFVTIPRRTRRIRQHGCCQSVASGAAARILLRPSTDSESAPLPVVRSLAGQPESRSADVSRPGSAATRPTRRGRQCPATRRAGGPSRFHPLGSRDGARRARRHAVSP
jgi:hypothetical protein